MLRDGRSHELVAKSLNITLIIASAIGTDEPVAPIASTWHPEFASLTGDGEKLTERFRLTPPPLIYLFPGCAAVAYTSRSLGSGTAGTAAADIRASLRWLDRAISRIVGKADVQ